MRRAFTYGGVFLVALASLMLEILLTRITSVVAWYHLAFFVISLGMLGMTAGAVIVFVLPGVFDDARVPMRMRQSALGFGLSIPACLGATLSMPLSPVSDLMGFLALCTMAATLSLPFILGGITLTLALTRAGLPASRVYAADLVGAAAGCLLIIPVLGVMDAPSAALLTGGIAALSAACFALAEGGRPLTPLVAATVVAGLGVLNAQHPAHPFRPAWVKSQRESAASYEYLAWNSYSRVTVEHEKVAQPTFWARGRNTPTGLPALRQRTIRIDGAAATVMTRMGASPERHDYLEWDISSFVHRLRPTGAAAVIGVGGGRDVLAALQAGHSPVVGIELNDLIVGLHRGGYRGFSGLADTPGLELVADEARSYLARETRKFETLTMSLIDTWASTGAGAYSLSENGLYTREAWSVFMRRLTPTGIFTVSRWYVPKSPGETARMLALAMDTLWTLGIERPTRHLILVQNGQVCTLLVSPTPFSEQDTARAEREATRRGFHVMASPRTPPRHPSFRGVLLAEDRRALAAWADSQLLDVSPPTDARPFFFNMLRPRTWLLGQAQIDEMDLPILGNLRSTQTLVYATLASVLLTLLTVALPLWFRRHSLRPVGRLDLMAACGYFALIGLGFMCVEIGLLSHLNVFIGHPTLALAVLLGGIIFFAGLGSLVSDRIPAERLAVAWLYPLAPALLVLAEGLLLVPVMGAFEAAPQTTRVLVSLGLLAPPALCLGICFPLGLRLVEALEATLPAPEDGTKAPLGPWLWGINGACGVCASGIALGISMTWGVPVTLLVGASCYLLLPLASAHLSHAAGRG